MRHAPSFSHPLPNSAKEIIDLPANSANRSAGCQVPKGSLLRTPPLFLPPFYSGFFLPLPPPYTNAALSIVPWPYSCPPLVQWPTGIRGVFSFCLTMTKTSTVRSTGAVFFWIFPRGIHRQFAHASNSTLRTHSPPLPRTPQSAIYRRFFVPPALFRHWFFFEREF